MAERIDASTLDIQEKLVEINRVAKVVKGGRTFRFSALMVVGDGNGHVGCGTGKAAEIPDAIRKGIEPCRTARSVACRKSPPSVCLLCAVPDTSIEDAKKNMITVPLVGTTIPHEVIGEFGAGRVLIKPAKEGTGVIAGGAARAVLELAGVRDIRTKCLRSNNKKNVVKATIAGLADLKQADEVAQLRGKTVDQIRG